MTDHELLELAAKAAGYTLYPEWDCAVTGIFLGQGCEGDLQRVWDPLTDDGDALRLAAKLRLDIRIYEDETVVETPWAPGDQRAAGSDVLTNTRRAIVLAAAQIGVMRKGQSS